jgi:O-antigen ligase
MLVAFTAVLFIAPQENIPGAGALHLAQLTGGAAVVAYGFERIAGRRRLWDPTPETRVALVLAAWGLLLGPISFWPGGSIGFMIDVWLRSVLIFLLLSQVLTTPERFKALFWTFTAVSVPIGFTAVKNFVTLSGDRIVGYAGPLTENPNDLALTLNLFVPMTVALMLMSKRPLTRVVLAAVLLLDTAAIFATFSRSGFLTLILSALLCAHLLPRRQRGGAGLMPTVVLIGAALIAVTAAPSSYVDRLHSIVDVSVDRTGSASERLADAQTALAYIATHPILGGGAGMSVLALNEFRDTNWTKVHNVYLETAVDLGIPGLLLLLALWRSAARSARAARTMPASAASAAGTEVPLIGGAIEIALWVFAVAALFHPVSYQFYFYYLAGMAAALRNGAWACSREYQSSSS